MPDFLYDPPVPPTIQTGFTQRIDLRERGKVVASARWHSAIGADGVAQVLELTVVPEQRRKGNGSTILNAAIAQAVACGRSRARADPAHLDQRRTENAGRRPRVPDQKRLPPRRHGEGIALPPGRPDLHALAGLVILKTRTARLTACGFAPPSPNTAPPIQSIHADRPSLRSIPPSATSTAIAERFSTSPPVPRRYARQWLSSQSCLSPAIPQRICC